MLSTVEPDNWESMDIENLDLDNFVQRFERLRMGDLKPASMNVYGQRIRGAITAYREFLRSPSTWQYTGSRSDQPARSAKRASKTTSRADSTGSIHQLPTVPAGNISGLISYPYPLRPNVVLSIALPADLTQKEAARLSTFLHSLAVDEQLALPVASGEAGYACRAGVATAGAVRTSLQASDIKTKRTSYVTFGQARLRA